MRNVIFIIGLFIMPLIWGVFNIINVMFGFPNTKYISFTFLYTDFCQHYKSGQPFGSFD